MKKIDVKELKDNFFETVSKEWMLVTAGNKEQFNTMTASWGCIGFLWNKNVAIIFVRPERYTHEFIEKDGIVTLAFLGNEPEARKIYSFCGSKSGRDYDKMKETGLKPIETEFNGITYEQARLTLECKKIYKDNIKPELFLDSSIEKWYGGKNGGYHDVYILEIVNAYVK